jgi:hypothetical protein
MGAFVAANQIVLAQLSEVVAVVTLFEQFVLISTKSTPSHMVHRLSE